MRLAIFILFFGIVSCTHVDSGNGDTVGSNGRSRAIVTEKKLPPVQYVSWVEDIQNGLKKQKTIEDIIYTAQYRPCPYVVCEEEKKNELPDTTIKRRVAELNGMQYISLRVEVKDGNGEFLKHGISTTEEYNDRINYFSFGMQKDLQLVEGGDTLQCLLFHFERLYNVAPYGTFVLAFPNGKDVLGDKTLIFFDRGFNKGIVKLFFKGSDIKNIPQLEVI